MVFLPNAVSMGEHLVDGLHTNSVKFGPQIVPQNLKDTNIVIIIKKKGGRAICSNSRGISLLAAAGKVLSKIMLTWLIQRISEGTLPETQSGFCKEYSTTDMIFVTRQIQEKCWEQKKNTYGFYRSFQSF